jgi:hypothetical protein
LPTAQPFEALLDFISVSMRHFKQARTYEGRGELDGET